MGFWFYICLSVFLLLMMMMSSSSSLSYSGENITGLQILYIKFVGYNCKVLHHHQIFNCLCTNNILYSHTRFHMHIAVVHYLLPSDIKKRYILYYCHVILPLLEYYCNRNCYFLRSIAIYHFINPKWVVLILILSHKFAHLQEWHDYTIFCEYWSTSSEGLGLGHIYGQHGAIIGLHFPILGR
jgi:hypothetical protein